MGLFDKFRSRVREVATDTDTDNLSAPVESEEAITALKEMHEAQQTPQPVDETPKPSVGEAVDNNLLGSSKSPSDEREGGVAIIEQASTESEWDDLDDVSIPESLSPKKSKRERKKEARAREAKPTTSMKKPTGSKVDLKVDRSTTGRKLVSLKQAPTGSVGPITTQTEGGRAVEVDLGGGIVEKGGRIIKSGPALNTLLDDLELILLEADISSSSAREVMALLRAELVGRHLRKGADLEKVVEASLKRALRHILAADYWNLDATVDDLLKAGDKPVSIMMVGVNGTGKTTTVAKLAARLQGQGKRVVLAAADTFRAGAIDQLEVHAERLGIKCISSQRGGDPAAIARDAIEHAKARRMDVVLVDTAGRMQNKINLMEELRKVHRVCQPHLVLFVGDALAGNDAVEQAVEFQRMLKFDGAVLSKLDTDAKGGAALSIAYATSRPIVMVGMGQEYSDLLPFDPDWLLDQLFE